MRWYLEDIENARKKAREKIAPVADGVVQELNIGKNDDLFIVGGFVRDNMLAALTGKEIDSKDIDLIVPTRPDFENNSNIIWKKENSLGGMKIGTKNFSEIDIFQPNTTDVKLMVGEYFDFNCNALYYSHLHKDIFIAAYFYDFIGRKEINFEHYIYTPIENKNGMEQRYSNASMISRALKYQIMFNEKFGLKIKLSPIVLYLLYEMKKDEEQEMFDYTKIKVKSKELQNKIINEYKRLKYR